MRLSRPLGLTILNVALLAVSACSDGVAPLDGSDPELPPGPVTIDAPNLIARIDDMTAVFAPPEFNSLRHSLAFVDVLFGFGRVAPAGNTPSPSALLSGTGPLRILAPTTSVLTNSIVDGAEGKTYVFGTSDFVPDPAATGAPENGVRVVMHGWHPLAEAPNLPLTRLGYADFEPAPSGDPLVDELRARLVRDEGNVLLADYTIFHDANPGRAKLGVSGFAVDGASRVNFYADVATESYSLNSFIWSPPRSDPGQGGHPFIVALTLGEKLAPGVATLTIAYDGHLLTLTLVNGGAEVRVDGRLYATIAFVRNADDVVVWQYAKPDGTPLAQADAKALDDLINTAGLAGFRFHDLVWF